MPIKPPQCSVSALQLGVDPRDGIDVLIPDGDRTGLGWTWLPSPRMLFLILKLPSAPAAVIA